MSRAAAKSAYSAPTWLIGLIGLVLWLGVAAMACRSAAWLITLFVASGDLGWFRRLGR